MFENKIHITTDSIRSMNRPFKDICEELVNKSIINETLRPVRHIIKVEDMKGELSGIFRDIKKVIFNNPATIVIWSDNTKTVVKCEDGETYDKEKGFLLCWLKGIKGSKHLQKELAKWVYTKEEK